MGAGSPTDRTSSLDASRKRAHADGMRWVALSLFLFLVGCGENSPRTMITGAAGTTGTGGSGGSDVQWPMVLGTAWSIRLNGGQPPSCEGIMSLTLSRQNEYQDIVANGTWQCDEPVLDCQWIIAYQDASWECLHFGGQVLGVVRPSSGYFTLTAATEPGFNIHLEGTMTASAMVGTAMFSDGSLVFEGALR